MPSLAVNANRPLNNKNNASTSESNSWDSEIYLVLSCPVIDENGNEVIVDYPAILPITLKSKREIRGAGPWQNHLSKQNFLLESLHERVQSLNPGEELKLTTFTVKAYRRKEKQEQNPPVGNLKVVW